MARWQVTLSHPSSLIPAVVLECFGEEGYSRIDPNQVTTGDRTPYGTMTLQRGLNKYLWSFTVDLTEAEVLRLGALIDWQNTTYDLGQDGHLLLTDEVRYLDPQPSPHSRTLLSAISAGYDSRVYGFGQFKVKLIRPSNGGVTIQGWDYGNAAIRQLVQLNAEEI